MVSEQPEVLLVAEEPVVLAEHAEEPPAAEQTVVSQVAEEPDVLAEHAEEPPAAKETVVSQVAEEPDVLAAEETVEPPAAEEPDVQTAKEPEMLVAEETVEPPAAEELEAPPVTVQGDRTEEQPKQQEQPEQPKETKVGEPSVLQMAWSGKRAPSMWDFCAGSRSSSSSSTAPARPAAANPGKKLGNPALAGQPLKPRCKQCGVELYKGICVNFKCRSHDSR